MQWTSYRRCITWTSFIPVAALVLAGCGSVPLGPAASKPSGSPTSATSKTAAHTAPALPAAGSGRGGYYQDDGPGDKVPEGLQALPDAEPKIEAYSKRGNRPYVVFGKTYTPITDDQPLTQRGVGSWYGKKFHGQKTSSGELYDMYKMTAAHPTLPIPSYARVTNVANGTQVIVRVNDRGPFHSARIMDLSYAAALKLGYLNKGSSELEVTRILPAEIARMANDKAAMADTPAQGSRIEPVVMPAAPAAPVSLSAPSASQRAVEAMFRADANPASAAPAASAPNLVLESASVNTTLISATALSSAGQLGGAMAKPVVNAAAGLAAPARVAGDASVPLSGFYVQLGAYAQAHNAESARAQLMQSWAGKLPPLEVVQNGDLYRLWCGPYTSKEEALAAAQNIPGVNAAKPLIVQR